MSKNKLLIINKNKIATEWNIETNELKRLDLMVPDHLKKIEINDDYIIFMSTTLVYVLEKRGNNYYLIKKVEYDNRQHIFNDISLYKKQLYIACGSYFSSGRYC